MISPFCNAFWCCSLALFSARTILTSTSNEGGASPSSYSSSSSLPLLGLVLYTSPFLGGRPGPFQLLRQFIEGMPSSVEPGSIRGGVEGFSAFATGDDCLRPWAFSLSWRPLRNLPWVVPSLASSFSGLLAFGWALASTLVARHRLLPFSSSSLSPAFIISVSRLIGLVPGTRSSSSLNSSSLLEKVPCDDAR